MNKTHVLHNWNATKGVSVKVQGSELTCFELSDELKEIYCLGLQVIVQFTKYKQLRSEKGK